MGKFNDLTGRKYGKLTVIAKSQVAKHNKIHWDVLCECGKTTVASTGSLTTGRYKSCGCAKRNRIIEMNKAGAKPRVDNPSCTDCGCALHDINWWASWKKKHTTICISCGRKRHANWDTKEKSKSRQLRNKYKITQAEYDLMLVNQDYRCGICGAENKKFVGGLHVDHDHTTGKVRGLLCNACNTGLGNFKDDTRSLNAAIMYLIKNYEGK